MAILFDKMPVMVRLVRFEPFYVPSEDVEGKEGNIIIELEDHTFEEHKFRISILGDIETECFISSFYSSRIGDFFSRINRRVLEVTETYSEIECKGETGPIPTVGKEIRLDFRTQIFTFKRIKVKIDKCELCKDIFNIASQSGCGIGLAAICAVVGIPLVIPGVACLGIAAVVCHYIGKHGIAQGLSMYASNLRFAHNILFSNSKRVHS